MSENQATPYAIRPSIKVPSGPPQALNIGTDIHLVKFSKLVLKELLQNCENDGIYKGLSFTIKEMCEQLLYDNGYNTTLARFWKDAVKQILGSLREDNNGYYSLPNLVQDIYSQILDPKRQRQLNEERFEVWAHAVREFCREYLLYENTYKNMTKYLQKRFNSILKPNTDRPQDTILHQVSSRTKRHKSLSKKADKIAKWLSTKHFDPGEPMSIYNAKYLLKENIRDIVGIRVLVYFPEDVPKVVHIIRDASDFEIERKTISFTKSRVDERKNDQEHPKNGGNPNYSDGPWATVPVSLDEVEHRWKHSGYRAIHMLVRLKEAQILEVNQSDKNETLQYEGNDIEVVSDSDEGQTSDTNVEAFIEKMFEVQITTVVMHAWSQVEHDVIYKNPYRIPATKTMARMLDSFNGLAITSEIMLEELQLNIDEKKESMTMPVNSEDEFLSRLHKTYLSEGVAAYWRMNASWLPILIHTMLGHRLGNPYPTSLAQVQKLCPDFEKVGTEDICVAMLKAAGLEQEKKNLNVLKDTNRYCPCFENSNQSRHFHHTAFCCLRKMLLFYNAFSIMMVMDGYFVFESLKQQFPWDQDINGVIKTITKISSILTGEDEGFLRDLKTLQYLRMFSAQFFSANWCEIHHVAVALTYHYFFLQEISKDWNWPKGILTSELDMIIFQDFFSIEPMSFFPIGGGRELEIPADMGRYAYCLPKGVAGFPRNNRTCCTVRHADSGSIQKSPVLSRFL